MAAKQVARGLLHDISVRTALQDALLAPEHARHLLDHHLAVDCLQLLRQDGGWDSGVLVVALLLGVCCWASSVHAWRPIWPTAICRV